MNIQDRNKSNIVAKLAIVVFLFVLMGCNNTRFINIRCRQLSDYERIRTYDLRTKKTVVFDSTQYRQYLLSFSDTTNNSSISGVFFVEKCYRFEKGLVLIVEKDSCKYEVIVIADETQNVTPKKYYKMKITPYFYFKGRTYQREMRNAIYHKHYVIYPAYILRNEECICTADFNDIVDSINE